jgi:hypothetical protein
MGLEKFNVKTPYNAERLLELNKLKSLEYKFSNNQVKELEGVAQIKSARLAWTKRPAQHSMQR